MYRLRLLAVKAFPKLKHEQQEPILISAFSRGLVDIELTTNLATIILQTTEITKRLAFANSSMRTEFKGRRSNGAYYVDEVKESEEKQNSDTEEHSQF